MSESRHQGTPPPAAPLATAKRPRLSIWLKRPTGSAIAEFLVVTPVLLALGAGSFQGLLAYHAKTII